MIVPLVLLPLAYAAAAAAAASASLAVQAGHHVIYSWPGTTPPQTLYNAIAAGKVGGLIIFGENVDDSLPATIQNLQASYRQSPNYSGYPLLVLTDQEGGQVNRLPGGPTSSEKQVGQASNPSSAAAAAGSTAAQVLLQYNHNGNLSPVTDVYRTAGDFTDQYGRSYSKDPSVVGSCAASYITALQARGVVATAKHFPGLGAAGAKENTDERPVTLNISLADLRSIDEAPYRDAIKAQVKMIMPSWAVYPALDSQRPSGLSQKWIQGELRGRLGFKGVTISDAIEAGALQSFGSQVNRATLAANAGMDIILAAARNATQGAAIADGLVAAIQGGQVNRTEFDAATQRILKLRSQL